MFICRTDLYVSSARCVVFRLTIQIAGDTVMRYMELGWKYITHTHTHTHTHTRVRVLWQITFRTSFVSLFTFIYNHSSPTNSKIIRFRADTCYSPREISNTISFKYLLQYSTMREGTRRDWGTALQTGSSGLDSRMSPEFFIKIILPTALWP
jgi:hypothetical protein